MLGISRFFVVKFFVLSALCFTMVDMFFVIDHLHCNITVGKANATLTLGTHGYSLKESNNTTWTIGFLSQLFPTIPYLVLTFCDFKADAEILVQIKAANTVTLAPFLSKFAAIGLVLGLVFFQQSRDAKFLASIGSLSLIAGTALNIFFKLRNSSCSFGPGFWSSGICAIVFAIFAISNLCPCLNQRAKMNDSGGEIASEESVEEEYSPSRSDSFRDLDEKEQKKILWETMKRRREAEALERMEIEKRSKENEILDVD